MIEPAGRLGEWSLHSEKMEVFGLPLGHRPAVRLGISKIDHNEDRVCTVRRGSWRGFNSAISTGTVSRTRLPAVGILTTLAVSLMIRRFI